MEKFLSALKNNMLILEVLVLVVIVLEIVILVRI